MDDGCRVYGALRTPAHGAVRVAASRLELPVSPTRRRHAASGARHRSAAAAVSRARRQVRVSAGYCERLRPAAHVVRCVPAHAHAPVSASAHASARGLGAHLRVRMRVRLRAAPRRSVEQVVRGHFPQDPVTGPRFHCMCSRVVQTVENDTTGAEELQ